MVGNWNTGGVASCERCFNFCMQPVIYWVFSSHHQPDWFMDSLKHLQPLLARRNEAYSKWIGTGNPEDLVIFKMARQEARQAVREAKNRWFREKAATV